MTFYFHCPAGHLLQSDEAQIGTSCVCSVCGMQITFPAPSEPATAPGEPPAAPPLPNIALDSARLPEAFTQLGLPDEPELFHIPCPRGHQLETPEEMLNRFAMCPECGTRFWLRRSNSVEFQRQQEAKEEQRVRRMTRTWMNWAIVLLVVAVTSVSLLVVLSRR